MVHASVARTSDRWNALMALIPLAAMVLSTVVAAGACRQAPRQTPTAPSLSLPSTSDLRISGVPPVADVGESIQLAASVMLPDGQRKLADAQWRSSNASVATISNTGLLSVVGRGAATIFADALEQS